ncbi:nucleotide exchange factor GrpE [Candidatus Woesearchaeota archaeon]|jgi:molecular chaperone GrpE|nr:nucleotide exchange factor GrpE [Candidatus Woesearchaeota archaeon]MBT6518680.1 nucleotide exchange factor GrpE [Candidatus Woesearchaeota archaeon]MBT7368869.1 nucleotide exchange factor GrpE [Candidatus Woesearchaeota archaeon]
MDKKKQTECDTATENTSDDSVNVVEKLEQQVGERTEMLQRLQAEFENYKKRVEKENSEKANYYKCTFINKLLPVLDTFEIALTEKSKESHSCCCDESNCDSDCTDSKKGLELIYAQLMSVLKELGLMQIICCGQHFDSEYHEVMLTESCESDDDDEKIIEELQKGYFVESRVIRHSKVKILKKK